MELIIVIMVLGQQQNLPWDRGWWWDRWNGDFAIEHINRSHPEHITVMCPRDWCFAWIITVLGCSVSHSASPVLFYRCLKIYKSFSIANNRRLLDPLFLFLCRLYDTLRVVIFYVFVGLLRLTHLYVSSSQHPIINSFAAVGYFNYRYFVNFLMFACISMLYAASLSYTPFLQLSTPRYREQFRLIKHHKQITNSQEMLPRLAPFLPYPHEKIYVTLTFMLSLAVGLAVMMLCAFHIYLVLTSQTTIEFHGMCLYRNVCVIIETSVSVPPCTETYKVDV